MTEREYGPGEVTHILEWLGREHGANAIELLCSELADEGESPVRREGAALGLGNAVRAVLGTLQAYAANDPSPGLRATCLDVLDGIAADAAPPTEDSDD